MPQASGNMPSAAASEVISTGRKRRWPERTSASTKSTPSASQMLHEVEHENAVFGHNADANDGAEE